MKIVVCDDVLQELAAAKDIIEEICRSRQVQAEVRCFAALEGCREYLRREHADIVVLDIFMGTALGTDFARELRDRYGDSFALIFLSGSNEFASESYDVRAAYYLLKPVTKEKMFTALQQSGLFARRQQIAVPVGRQQLTLNLRQIVAVEVIDKKCHIHTLQGNYEASISLSALLELLPEGQFWQVHRSFVINPEYVEEVRDFDFHMRGGMTVPIRRSGGADIKRRYMQWLFDRMEK